MSTAEALDNLPPEALLGYELAMTRQRMALHVQRPDAHITDCKEEYEAYLEALSAYRMDSASPKPVRSTADIAEMVVCEVGALTGKPLTAEDYVRERDFAEQVTALYAADETAQSMSAAGHSVWLRSAEMALLEILALRVPSFVGRKI